MEILSFSFIVDNPNFFYLLKARKSVLKDIRELQTAEPETFLNGAVDCHLRASSLAAKHKDKCHLCAVHDNIELYENALFHFIKGEIKGRSYSKVGRSR